MPSTHPKQYQDVKANLQWYLAILMAIVGFAVYAVILPSEHREMVNTLLGLVPSSQLVGSGVLMVLLGFVGWVMVIGLEIHDKTYDRYVVRWRHDYDLHFVLPALVRPMASELSPRFHEVAAANRYEFMKTFYHFVADYEHDHKVMENLVVRFYEAVTKYWITQLNELALILVFVALVTYYFVYRTHGLALDRIVLGTFALVALFGLNRFLITRTRAQVRRATTDEIEDIHSRFLPELRAELMALHVRFDMRYYGD